MHAVVLDFNAMWTDSNARQWYVKAILSYGVCCKKKMHGLTVWAYSHKHHYWSLYIKKHILKKKNLLVSYIFIQ